STPLFAKHLLHFFLARHSGLQRTQLFLFSIKYTFFSVEKKKHFRLKTFYITGYYSSCGSYNTILCKISSREKPCAPYTVFSLQRLFFGFLSFDFFSRITNPIKKMSQRP